MHPTELPILLELTPDVYITAQCTHTLELHHLSGDFQMSETRKKWEIAPFVCSWGTCLIPVPMLSLAILPSC